MEVGAVTALTERTFTGQALDSRTGLMYYRARWYDPRLGRFLQADTVVPGAGNPQALNRYGYVLNNPLRYTDPSGHAICIDDDECTQVTHPISGEIIHRRPAGPPLPLSLEEFSEELSPLPTPMPGGPLDEEGAICPGAIATGVIVAIPLAGWNMALGYTAVQVAAVPMPASLIGESTLLPIEAATFEADMLIAQLIAQGAQREYPQIGLELWPPYNFGPVPNEP